MLDDDDIFFAGSLNWLVSGGQAGGEGLLVVLVFPRHRPDLAVVPLISCCIWFVFCRWRRRLELACLTLPSHTHLSGTTCLYQLADGRPLHSPDKVVDDETVTDLAMCVKKGILACWCETGSDSILYCLTGRISELPVHVGSLSLHRSSIRLLDYLDSLPFNWDRPRIVNSRRGKDYWKLASYPETARNDRRGGRQMENSALLLGRLSLFSFK